MTKFVKILMVALLIVSCSKKDEKNVNQDYNLVIQTQDGDVKYIVENAVTPEELQEGLMFREELDANHGMIFDLSKVGPVAMWMKNTRVPLDMIFIGDGAKIVWLYEDAVPFSEEQIIPPVPVAAVIEINAGESRKNGIRVGDIVKHAFFNNFDEEEVAVVGSAYAQGYETDVEAAEIANTELEEEQEYAPVAVFDGGQEATNTDAGAVVEQNDEVVETGTVEVPQYENINGSLEVEGVSEAPATEEIDVDTQAVVE